MAFSTSAGAAGEGRLFTITGTVNAASPAVLMNFRPASGKGIGNGVDGPPANIVNFANASTDTTYFAAIVVSGLHDTNGTGNYYALTATGTRDFQRGELKDNIEYCSGYLLKSDGTAAPNSSTISATLSGSVIARRES